MFKGIVPIEYKGKSYSMYALARQLGITREKLRYWMRKHDLNWVEQNLDLLKQVTHRMSDGDYIALGLRPPSKRFRA